jgi:hypothetical protein
VAHACNPSYSVGSDQEDRNSKPAGQIVHETLSRKYPSQKRLAEWLKVKSLSSSPGTTKKKKKIILPMVQPNIHTHFVFLNKYQIILLMLVCSLFDYSFIYLAILEFELRALCLLDRCFALEPCFPALLF